MQSGFSKDKTVSAAIYYRGMGDDGEIDSQGFSSFFYASYSGEELKKADYVTFDYFDKALGKKESFKLSLAGFSACLSEFEAETRKRKSIQYARKKRLWTTASLKYRPLILVASLRYWDSFQKIWFCRAALKKEKFKELLYFASV